MSKRLFALLLAAVLVLSMGAAQVSSEQTSGTEQAEQDADVSVQAPDEADAAGDDVPDEDGEDDTLADEPDEPAGDDAPADETGGDGGEVVPAAVNDMPVQDGPQTAADGPAIVSVRFEGAEHILSLTADGADVLPDAQAGAPIVLSAAGEGPVTFDMELEDGYTAQAAENAPDSVRFEDGMVEIWDDGDGEAVVQIVERPQVMAVSTSGFTVNFEGAEHIVSVTNADDSTVYDLSKPVVFDADSAALQITVKDGYYVQETDECDLDKYYYPAGKSDYVEAFRLQDKNGDGTVTVRILKLITVKLVDDEGYVTQVTDSVRIYYSDRDGSLAGSYELKKGAELRLEAKVCALDVVGGHVSGKYYRLDKATGDLLSVQYAVEPDGAETMTATTRPDDQAPKPIKIEYAGEEDKIKDKENYVLPGNGFYAEPEEGYTISVEGDAFVEGSYFVSVNENAKSVKVTVIAVKTGAKLSATIPDALEPTDLYGMSKDTERAYVASGGTMENGQGCFTLKNGYAVGPGVTGGSVWLRSIESDEATGDIYSCYLVDATEETVTVPIVEAQPFRWVKVKVYDAFGCHCTVSNVLPAGGTSWSGSGDHEGLLLVLDELTATFNDLGYELAAVSGCTLRWEKDAYGKLIYHIIPDAAGDTSVELRVIEAGQQEPALKVGTDADEGVQTDAAAEGLLKAAIEEFAKGGVPAGMSSETADALKAALEEADAVTWPELSAVLRVKEADTAAVPGADAVYEIEIVLSVNGTEVGSLTELARPISISLPLPPVTDRIVYLVRVHDGEREKLDATVQNGAIRFATDRFSEFAIMSSNDLAHAAADPIPDQTWTGSALTPKVHVTITGPTGQETLEEGVDYQLVYKDNVKVGTATVTIVGMGDFSGTSMTVTFRIVGAKAGTTTSDSTAPATGDETPLALYTGLLALGVSGLAAVLLRRKKQQ